MRSKNERRAPLAGMLVIAVGSALVATGCGTDTSGDPVAQAQATVKTQITTQLALLVSASTALRAAAPTPDADGWNDVADAAAVTAMKKQWATVRVAYEQVEGDIAVIFPTYDVSTDERYDGFLGDPEVGPDADLFDGTGVTGVHAIERILWAGQAPADVVAFESTLTGYMPARFPSNLTEATEFRDGLAARLVTDFQAVQTMFAPLPLDTPAAFRGVIGSLGEQKEKIELAADGQDESRYSQHTLADMRANLLGGKNTYEAFRGAVRAKAGGSALDADILAGFDRVSALYAGVSGDALPPVPAGFDPKAPTTAQLATPYGQIFAGLTTESDPTNSGSLVSKMSAAADLLGIPALPQ
jgi:iron uptake system component EfeO